MLALLGVPAVVALHLFRRRFRPQVVSALFLWQMRDSTSVSGRRLERLHRSPSFWLEVLAALCLGLLFAGFRLPWTREAEHLVVVLDASASMGADDDEGNRAKRAQELIAQRIAALPARSRVTIITSGATPSLLAGPAAFPGDARTKLASFHPTAARHDLTTAIALGMQLADSGAVLLVTDDFQPDVVPPEVEIESIGQPLENVAITHAARTREGREDQIFLTITNFSDRPRQTDLTIGTGTRELARHHVELEPDQRRHFNFQIPIETPTLVAELRKDALAIDNRVQLSPIPPRTVALATTFEPELAVYLGLMTDLESASKVDRLVALLADTIDAGSAAAAHLVLAHVPPATGNTWALTLEGSAEEPQDLIGPFLAEKRHPLLEGLTLEGIVWSCDPQLTLDGAPLVSAGNQPLMTERFVAGTASDEARVFRMNFLPGRSSLQRSPDWPILLSNLVELRRRALPGPERTNLVMGEPFLYRDRQPGTYQLVGENFREELSSRGTLVIDEFPAPGSYQLMREDQELCRLAVNYCDAAESNLRTQQEGQRPSSVATATTAAGFGVMEMILLLVVLALLLADWWVLQAARGRGGAIAEFARTDAANPPTPA